MSTPTLNDEPIAYAKIAPNPENSTHVFIASKIAKGQLHCQECFKATGDRITVQLRFEGDRAIFYHDNCVLNPPNPKPLAITEPITEPIIEPITEDEPTGLKQYPITEEGWLWDPPMKIGDRCIIVTRYYHEWLFSRSTSKSQTRKIEDAYTKQAEWDCNSELVLVAIGGEVATVRSPQNITKKIPLRVLWTLEKSAIAA